MPATQTFNFHNQGIFSGLTGVIDSENSIIRGVSVITGGITAEGHDLEVDDTTLSQLQACGKAKGKIPVTLDHGAGVKDLNGYITGFRMDGDKLRGDWHLLTTHEETPKMLERATVMPECFGLSVAFKGPKAGVAIGNGKMAARCEKLLSIDCVTRPAANVGLFSVDSADNGNMAKANTATATPPAATNEPAEPTMADLAKLIQGLTDRQGEFENFINQQFAPDPTLEDLDQMSDDELTKIGLTRDEVNSAVAEALAGVEDPNAEPAAEGTPAANGELAGATAGSAAEVTAAGTATASGNPTFNALIQSVNWLITREKTREFKATKDADTLQMKTIDDKVNALQEQRDNAVSEVTELKAKNDALEVCLRTGTKPVKAGVDNGVRVFGAGKNGGLHPFQARVKELMGNGKTEGEAIRFAQKEDPQRHQAWVITLSEPQED